MFYVDDFRNAAVFLPLSSGMLGNDVMVCRLRLLRNGLCFVVNFFFEILVSMVKLEARIWPGFRNEDIFEAHSVAILKALN